MSAWVNFASFTSAHTLLTINCHNHDSAEKFWDLESIGIKKEKAYNYEKFTNLIHLNPEKRCETKLPLRENHEFFNNNY